MTLIIADAKGFTELTVPECVHIMVNSLELTRIILEGSSWDRGSDSRFQFLNSSTNVPIPKDQEPEMKLRVASQVDGNTLKVFVCLEA